MELFQIQKVSFTYPGESCPALQEVSLTVQQGEFITLCGLSGCGKSTLIRQLKPALTPHGTRTGTILFQGAPLAELPDDRQAADIGFVLQSPDNQLVTDKVWHELAFGLESLSCDTGEIRARVAETASFFGIQDWFYKNVAELSGGQKQLLNLASVMVMQPKVLILDEPTAQLDPIAAQSFLGAVSRVNRELGITVLVAEQRLEEVFPLSDRVIVMEEGHIVADGTPGETGQLVIRKKSRMAAAMPTPLRVSCALPNELPCPVTVRQGRAWMEGMAAEKPPHPEAFEKKDAALSERQEVLRAQDIWFRYEKTGADVLRGLSLTLRQGELTAVVGGNGTGKSTMLSLLCGLRKPYRGRITVSPGQKLLMLPQNPQNLFTEKSVKQELYTVLKESGKSSAEQAVSVQRVTELCELKGLEARHPYDLSGGEQQRAALAKLLLLEPDILLLDEPTKGLDAAFKQKLAALLYRLLDSGVTVLMVSHDVEFCAAYAHRCAMFFDGAITEESDPRRFFAGKSFYTTAANRMARDWLPRAVLAEDIVLAFGGQMPDSCSKEEKQSSSHAGREQVLPEPGGEQPESLFSEKRHRRRMLCGAVSVLLFVAAEWILRNQSELLRLSSVIFLGIGLFLLFPSRKPLSHRLCTPVTKPLSARDKTVIGLTLAAVLLTVLAGVYWLGDQKYYFISLLVILEIGVPFLLRFEGRRPKAREIVLLSVLCALGVAGRAAFFMLPQFKPVAAMVILSGVCFGGETGFLVGAMTAFVSNFFFGQGPWTPWQMMAFGLLGLLAGWLFRPGRLPVTRTALCVFGGFVTLVVYGGIMNPASVILWQAKPTLPLILASYALGFPLDLIHAASTVFFLFFAAEPLLEKLERVKQKYGLLE